MTTAPKKFILRRVSSAVGMIGILMAAVELARTARFRTSSLSDSYVLVVVVLGVVVPALASAIIVQLRRREPSRFLAVCLATVGIIAGLLLPGRLQSWIRVVGQGWPVGGLLDRWRLTSNDERIAFALRVAVSEVEDYRLERGDFPTRIDERGVGPHWSVPRDVTLRITISEDSTARLAGSLGGRICVLTLFPRSAKIKWHDIPSDPSCSREQQGRRDSLSGSLVRWTTPAPITGEHAFVRSTGAWMQYRSDEARHGSVNAALGAGRWAGWQARLWGEARGTPSIVGNVVLSGAHGTGALDARDRASGRLLWRAREPNWIHQEVVSDGRIAVDGFGDNLGSVYGFAPSGVSARELRTGALLWRTFTHGSVMTSPVIVSGSVVAGSSDGEVVALDLLTGRLRWEGSVPGAVIMASPSARGDTVFFSADPSTACAFLVSSGRRLWCSSVPNTLMLGHAAATVQGGSLILTSTRISGLLEQVLRGDSQLSQSLEDVLGLTRKSTGGETARTQVADQELVALFTATGGITWRTRVGRGKPPGGHTSGTSVAIEGTTDFLVLSPTARSVFRLDSRNGRLRWRSQISGPARGPVLVAGRRIIVMRADASMDIIDVETGAHICQMALPIGVDRAGPSLSGELAVFADLAGDVYAVDVQQLVRCSVDLRSLPIAEPE